MADPIQVSALTLPGLALPVEGGQVQALLQQLQASLGQDLMALITQKESGSTRIQIKQGGQFQAQGELPYPVGTELRLRVNPGSRTQEGSIQLQTLEARPPAPPEILSPLRQGEAVPLLARLSMPDPPLPLRPLALLFRLLEDPKPHIPSPSLPAGDSSISRNQPGSLLFQPSISSGEIVPAPIPQGSTPGASLHSPSTFTQLVTTPTVSLPADPLQPAPSLPSLPPGLGLGSEGTPQAQGPQGGAAMEGRPPLQVGHPPLPMSSGLSHMTELPPPQAQPASTAAPSGSPDPVLLLMQTEAGLNLPLTESGQSRLISNRLPMAPASPKLDMETLLLKGIPESPLLSMPGQTTDLPSEFPSTPQAPRLTPEALAQGSGRVPWSSPAPSSSPGIPQPEVWRPLQIGPNPSVTEPLIGPTLPPSFQIIDDPTALLKSQTRFTPESLGMTQPNKGLPLSPGKTNESGASLPMLSNKQEGPLAQTSGRTATSTPSIPATPLDGLPELPGSHKSGPISNQDILAPLNSKEEGTLSSELLSSPPAKPLDLSPAFKALGLPDALGKFLTAVLQMRKESGKALPESLSTLFTEGSPNKPTVSAGSPQSPSPGRLQEPPAPSQLSLPPSPKESIGKGFLPETSAPLSPEAVSVNTLSLRLPEAPQAWEAWTRATVKALSDPLVSPQEAPFHIAQAREGTAFYELPVPWAPGQSPMQIWVESDRPSQTAPGEAPVFRLLVSVPFSELGEARIGLESGPTAIRGMLWLSNPESAELDLAELEKELSSLGKPAFLKLLTLPDGSPSLREMAGGVGLTALA